MTINAIPSSSLEIQETFTPTGSYSIIGSDASDDFINTQIGGGAIKISIVDSATNTFATHEDINIDLSTEPGFFFQFYNRVVEQGFTNGITFFFSNSTDLSADRWNFVMSGVEVVPGWNVIWIDKNDLAVFDGSPTFANPIQSLRFRLDGTSGTERTVSFDGLFSKIDKTPSIIMTFDDGFEDSFVASEYATPRGVPMTHYIIPELIGTTDYLSKDQVDLLSTRDYIGSHYVDRWDDDGGASPGTSLMRMTAAKDGTKALVPWQGDHASWPLGQYGKDSTDGATEDGEFIGYANSLFLTTRTTTANCQFPDAGRLNPALLYSYPLNSSTTLTDAKNKVDESILTGTDLIFYGHRLGTPDTITWATQDFEDLIDYINEKRLDGDLVTRTIDTWYKDIQAVTTPILKSPGFVTTANNQE